MARPTGSRSKGLIIDAVEHLIAKEGVNAVSISAIAKSAHLSQGTIYYHYASKDEIIFDVIVRHINELKNEYVAWLSRHQTDLTSERFFEVIFYKGIKLYNRAKLHVFLINECLSDAPQLRAKFVELFNEWREVLLIGIKQIFVAHPDPEAIAHLTLLILDGLVVQEVIQGPVFEQQRLISLMQNIGSVKK